MEARRDAASQLQAIPEGDAISKVFEYAYGACILRGVRVDDEGLYMTAAALLAELKQDFPTLTIQELGYAIKNGCFEKYGEVYGINAVSLYKMVQGYLTERRVQDEERARQQGQCELRDKYRDFFDNYKPSTLGR